MATYEGDGTFVIVNNSGDDLLDLRLTHFMQGDDYERKAKLAMITELKSDTQSNEFTFHSYAGKDDHWCVAYRNNHGCWQSYDLDASMNGDYDPKKYQLIIEHEKLTFKATYKNGKDTHSSSKKIVSVYNGTKA